VIALSHAPARLGTYFRVHENVLEQLRRAGIVGDDTLEHVAEPGTIRIEGDIACLGGIVIAVRKVLSVSSGDDGTEYVQTFLYAYNASVRGHGNITRADNVHVHPGHTDEHHRHFFDWRTDTELEGSPRWVGAHGWPTLGAFILDVNGWYWANRDALPDPDGYPAV
jgi:hypothetical protein